MTKGIVDVLSTGPWYLGFCRKGMAMGSYVFLWRVADDLWDVEFNPPIDFAGSQGEEVVLFSVDDEVAVEVLESFDIDWAPRAEIAQTAAERYFPKSRVAHGPKARPKSRSKILTEIPGEDTTGRDWKVSGPWVF